MNLKQSNKFFHQVYSMLTILIMGNSSIIMAQVNHDVFSEKIKNNIVKLTSKFQGGSTEYGFGFIVGEQANLLYVVTAKHVVEKYDDEDDRYYKASPVTAEFYNAKSTGEVIKLVKILHLNLENKKLDLALLEIQKPSGFSLTDSYFTSEVNRGDAVWFIGRDKDWYVPALTGAVSKKTDDGKIKFEITTIKQGTSGAPLLTEKGIVGLITTDNGSDAAAIYAIEIKKHILEGQYPFMEIPASASETSYQVANRITPELKGIFSKISADALKLLIKIGEKSWTYNAPPIGFIELKLNNLARINEEGSYVTTDFGKQMYQAIEEIISDVIALPRTQYDAPPNIRTAISNISSDAVKFLLDTGDASHRVSTYHESWSAEIMAIKELESRRLVNFEVGVPDSDGNDVRYEATDLGISTHRYFEEIMMDLLVSTKTQYYDDKN